MGLLEALQAAHVAAAAAALRAPTAQSHPASFSSWKPSFAGRAGADPDPARGGHAVRRFWLNSPKRREQAKSPESLSPSGCPRNPQEVRSQQRLETRAGEATGAPTATAPERTRKPPLHSSGTSRQ